MWPYQNITRRQLEEAMDRVEALLLRLGAEPTRLGSPHPVAAYCP